MLLWSEIVAICLTILLPKTILHPHSLCYVDDLTEGICCYDKQEFRQFYGTGEFGAPGEFTMFKLTEGCRGNGAQEQEGVLPASLGCPHSAAAEISLTKKILGRELQVGLDGGLKNNRVVQLDSVYSSCARMAAQIAIQRTCTAAIKASEVLA